MLKHPVIRSLTRVTIAASDPLPAGPATIRFDFEYDGGGPGPEGVGHLRVQLDRIARGEERIEGGIDVRVPPSWVSRAPMCTRLG